MHELIASRWSPRGYDDTATVSVDEITEILDAGRWAPTWGRIQPVRFVVGWRGDEAFTRMTDTLNRGNRSWAPRASAFIMLCTTDEPDDEKAHAYGPVDLGLALSQMLIGARALGLHGHPMAGFDHHRAVEEFDIPVGKRPLVILAVGRLADDPETVPEEIRERDAAERTRLPLSEVAFGATWGKAVDLNADLQT